MIIRDFRIEDIREIAHLQRYLNTSHIEIDPDFYAPSPRARYHFEKYIHKRALDGNFKIIVAAHRNKLVGFVMGWLIKRPVIYKKRNLGYISNLFVLENFRKKGIGRKLMLKMEEWFIQDKHVDFIEIKADADNLATLKKFLEYGFREKSVVFNKKIHQIEEKKNVQDPFSRPEGSL